MPGQPPSSDDAQSSGAHPAGPLYQSGLNRPATVDRVRAPRQPRRGAWSRPDPKQARASTPPKSLTVTPSRGGGTLAAGQVLVAGLLALVLAAFLNADQLVRDAERKEFGNSRDVSLAIWEPVQAVANALQLTEPRRVADEALGREFLGPFSIGPPTTEVAAPPTTAAADQPSGSTAPDPTSATTAPIVETTTTVPITTTTEAPRIPSQADQLLLWVGGDSMAQVFGESLVRLGSDTGIIEPTLDYKISSGLTRPDFFNWPAHLTDVMSNDDPEVMVVIFGANDAQGMELSNGVFQPFDDEWVAEYSTRVGFAMDLLVQSPDRLVIWVGQPIMRSANFDARMNRLNQVYEEQSLLRERIIYMDTRALFSNSSGEYEAFLPALDGDVRNLRQQDGTHLSRAGGDVLADAVLDLLGDYVDLETGRVPVTTVVGR